MRHETSQSSIRILFEEYRGCCIKVINSRDRLSHPGDGLRDYRDRWCMGDVSEMSNAPLPH